MPRREECLAAVERRHLVNPPDCSSASVGPAEWVPRSAENRPVLEFHRESWAFLCGKAKWKSCGHDPQPLGHSPKWRRSRLVSASPSFRIAPSCQANTVFSNLQFRGSNQNHRQTGSDLRRPWSAGPGGWLVTIASSFMNVVGAHLLGYSSICIYAATIMPLRTNLVPC